MEIEDKSESYETTVATKSNKKQIMKIIVTYLIVTMLLLFIIGFGYSMQNPEITGKFLYSLLPNSHLSFTKVNSSRPACKIAQIKGYFSDLKNLNVYPVYDEQNIYLYDSYSLDNLITTIPVAGHVNSVSCYVTADLWMARTGDRKFDKLKRIPDGLYINCLYIKDGKNRFLCQFIPAYAFTTYYLSKTGDKETVEKLIKDSTSDNTISRLFNPSGRKQIINGKIMHPGLVADEIINVPFDNLEFLGLSFDKLGVTNIIAKDLSSKSIVILNDKGKIKAQYKIDRPFTAYVNYYLDYANVYVFDGANFFHFSASDDRFICYLKTPVDNGTFSNASFVPSSDDDFAYIYNPVIENNGKIIQIEEYNKYRNPKMYKVLDMPAETKFVYYDHYNANGSSYVYDFEKNNTKNIGYSIINRFHTCTVPKFSNPELYEFTDYASLGIDKNNNCIILYFVFNEVYLVDTFGIDEPVSEAYVTHEDNKLTIYFMNKNSVYRWQNFQDSISNIKFRKLNIEPEPIKTTPTN